MKETIYGFYCDIRIQIIFQLVAFWMLSIWNWMDSGQGKFQLQEESKVFII